jgi:hypothetical protein
MDTEHEAALAALQREFPAYFITLEIRITGPRFIARSRHLGQNPHTVITRDPEELRATLAAAQAQQQSSSTHPGPIAQTSSAAPAPVPPQRRPA